MAQRETYQLGEFILDPAERRLSQQGHPIPLAPKAHDLLVALVRDAGRLVTKRELLERVWPESFVEEGILAVHISSLRKVLGGERAIETVPRQGYRYVGRVNRHAGNGDGPRWKSAAQPEVYELLGQGRTHLLSASPSDVPKAIATFRAAIQLDPTYAPAHAGLALACCAQAAFRLIAPPEAYSEAKSAALRALAMDDACADAQVALGTVLYFSDWNWAGTRRSLDRALEINPSHTEAYVVYGQLLETLCQLEKGLAMKQKALERDPLSAQVHLQISLSYFHQRRYDESIRWANRALELDPKHLLAREHLAGAYWKKGDFDRYMAENVKHAESYGVPAEALAPLKHAYAAEGRPGVVKLFLQRAASQPQAFPAVQLAIHYGEAGDLDAAFHHLERAIESRDPCLVHLAVAPQWDGLRADPRFDRCLDRMGLISPA